MQGLEVAEVAQCLAGMQSHEDLSLFANVANTK
jgi:hypothetical protein